MNTFYLYNVFLLLFFTLKIQGSSVYPSGTKLFIDDYVVRHFGETPNLNALIRIIKKASYAKIVDAIIDCPSQMLEILFKDYSANSNISLDRLVRYVRGSHKISAFYSALRNLPSDYIRVKREWIRQSIYFSSFFYDIPSN